MAVFCGVDVGQGRVFPVALDTSSTEIVLPAGPMQLSAAVAWLAERKPTSIAIDAPSMPNAGLLADPEYQKKHDIDLAESRRSKRVAEWRLGIGGCYATPATKAECPPWMQTGMDLFDGLKAIGFRLDLGGGGNLFEVHPTYGFKSAISIDQHGLRVRCDARRWLGPKLPRGSKGHHQRIGLLRRLLAPSIQWRDDLEARLMSSLDWTDALLAAALAMLRDSGGTLHVGDPECREGGITILREPIPLQESELDEARTTKPAGTVSRTSALGGGKRKASTADGVVLRLGECGPGGLSQSETLERLLAMRDNEGGALLPIDRDRIGKEWIQRAESGGLRLLLAWGPDILADLTVGRIEGAPPASLRLEDFGEDADIWHPVVAAPYWAFASEVRTCNIPMSSLLFSHGGIWELDRTRSQQSWLAFREPDKGSTT